MSVAVCANEIISSEKPYRVTVEALLYLAIGSRAFANQLGVLDFAGLSGALILGSGFVCLVVMLARQERLPGSFLFAVLISLLATIVDLYLIDYAPRNMLFWTSTLLMMCYVVRDPAAHLRCALFLAACVFLAVAIGGTYFSGMEGVQRLGLEPGTVATMFGNPNDLAQISLITAFALLFLGFRCNRLLSALCLLTAIGLIGVVLLTVSRQGLILLAVGLAGYLAVVLFTRSRKLEALLLCLAALAVVVVFRNEVAGIIDNYLFRLGLDSGRVDYWKTAPRDLGETLLVGYGTINAYTSEGLQPHSAFLWLHLAYGGLCAWAYVAWLLWLGGRTVALTLDARQPGLVKIESLVMFLIFTALQFTGVFTPYNYGCILAVATLEARFSGLEVSDAET